MTLNAGKRVALVSLVAIGTISAAFFGVAAMASDDAPTVGRVPEAAFRSDGSIDRTQVPDYIPALDRRGDIVGYVARDEVMPQEGLEPPGELAPQDKPETVYDKDLKTVVGHMYPARGFVPVGTDPRDVPPISVSISEGAAK
ncbi:MAG: hypothetical protein WD271_05295 [Acidimicrobiia bacterium]